MRVIWVTPAVPHPAAAGGWANEFELIRALAPRHEIEVVSSDVGDPLDEGELVAAGATFTRVTWEPEGYPTNRIKLASAVLRADPSLRVWLKRGRLEPLAQQVCAMDRTRRVDLVHITQQELAPLVSMVRPPTGLLLYDSLTREIEQSLALERSPRRQLQLWVERRRSRRFERRWYPRATGLAAVSSVDAEWVQRHVGIDVAVVENSVADRLFEPSPAPRADDLVLFVGTLNHYPNEDAARWLVTEIWPQVRHAHPGARLRIVGRDDPRRLAAGRLQPLVDAAGGELLVDVDDVRDHYREATVVVAPMRLGGGMRSKVVHAMAAGAPMVATPIGMEGLGPEAQGQAVIGASADEIVAGVVAALASPAAARSRGAAGAETVAELRASAVSLRLEAWWRGLVG